jgi:hypothetical protein
MWYNPQMWGKHEIKSIVAVNAQYNYKQGLL